MKHLYWLLLCSVLCLPAGATKVALLVGCNGYEHFPALKACVADVKRMQSVLRQAGYEVYALTDESLDPDGNRQPMYYPDKRNIETQLKKRAAPGSMGKGDILLFFFSGHGMHADGDDYLVPLDVTEVNTTQMVKCGWVHDVLRKTGAENVVIITDACRSEGKAIDIGKGFKGGEDQLAKMPTDEQFYALLRSCAEDQVSYERDDNLGGRFAYYLAEGLAGQAARSTNEPGEPNNGEITVEMVFNYAKERVVEDARKAEPPQLQVPQIALIDKRAGKIPLAKPALTLKLLSPPELAEGKNLEIEADEIAVEGLVDDVPGVEVAATGAHVAFRDAAAGKDLKAKRMFQCKVPLPNEGLNKLTFVASDTRGHRVALEAWVRRLRQQPTINPKDRAELEWIPGGEFLMGNAEVDKNPLADNKPAHRITVNGFRMYKYAVTVRMYRAFCAATERQMPLAPDWGWHDDHPMVNVSWNDANAYAEWAGAGLPTEAEWERAARGGDDRKYVWGNAWPPPRGTCNCADEKCHQIYQTGKFLTGYSDGFAFTSPVDSFAPNPYRLYDMVGNVWQWCADWYDDNYYTTAIATNPRGPNKGTGRVLRGGSWSSGDQQELRVTHREWDDPEHISNCTGFRCVVRQPE